MEFILLPGFSYWLIVRNNELLVLAHNYSLPNTADIAEIEAHFLTQFNLGSLDKIEYYCAELDSAQPIPAHLCSLSLRSVLALCNSKNYPICVKAYSALRWDKTHRYCGQCGNLTQLAPLGFERQCSVCKLSFYPRISPSIIVLIKKEKQVLMARGPHFLPGAYGLIAGFVEIGEDLEEAVHREVKEEVGLEIKNLTYFGSQAWPFPDSLMVAFMADYASGDLVIDKQEIETAGWYHFDNLPGLPSLNFSIATRLLNSFLDSCKRKKT